MKATLVFAFDCVQLIIDTGWMLLSQARDWQKLHSLSKGHISFKAALLPCKPHQALVVTPALLIRWRGKSFKRLASQTMPIISVNTVTILAVVLLLTIHSWILWMHWLLSLVISTKINSTFYPFWSFQFFLFSLEFTDEFISLAWTIAFQTRLLTLSSIL